MSRNALSATKYTYTQRLNVLTQKTLLGFVPKSGTISFLFSNEICYMLTFPIERKKR